MTQIPTQAPGDDDLRLTPVLALLWAGGGAVDAAAVGAAARLFQESARAAVGRWPEIYRGPGRARLVCRDDDPPPAAAVEAAMSAGIEIDSHADAATACDAALVGKRDFAALPAWLPALVAEAGAPLRLAVDAGVEPKLEGALRQRNDVEASPAAIAEALLSPPRRLADRRDLLAYQRENPQRRAHRYEYSLLLRLIGEPREVGGAADDSWARAAAANSAASVDRSEALESLRRDYERADALALAYGRRWRSTLAARSFLLFAANFASGFVGALFPFASPVTVPLQFAASGLLYLDQIVARRRGWRVKWIDYRRVAEAARIARFCVLAGVALPEAESQSWVDWRLERALRGAPAAALAERDAAGFLAYLSEVEIDPQIAYHRGAYRRFRRLDARLRRAATTILLASVALGAALAAIALSGLWRAPVSLLAAVGLALSAGPGLSAALNGLRGQLDVVRQAARSARIGVALRRLRRALAGAPPNAALARSAARRAAEIMLDDVSAWDRAMEIV
jgi:hypothetical protein